MKKEYLILILLILLFIAYLFFKTENRDHFTLPAVTTVNPSEITGITVEQKGRAIRFIKKDKHWVVTDKEYPAHEPSINNMLDTLKNLKLTALISQQKDFMRYELDDAGRMRVQVRKGENPIFELFVGKTAPSFNHTFVMLSGDTNIYHAQGNFRSHFDKTLDDFRDKKVMAFQEDSIRRISITHGDLSKTLTSEETKDKENTSALWHSEDGTAVDAPTVSDLLSTLSSLECRSFPESLTSADMTEKLPTCRITLENDAAMTLTLFQDLTEETVQGVSSTSPYVFELAPYNGNRIITFVRNLLDITPEDKADQ